MIVKNRMLKLGGNIELLENSYKELLKNDDIDLLISKKISSIDFGLVPALIQFISTWYRRTKSSKIIIDIKKEEDLEELYHLDYLFPSVVFCWNRDIEDSEGNSLKPLLKIKNEEQYEVMRTQGGKGQKILLSCFDHLSIRKGLLNAFYIDGTFISNEMEFDFAIDKAIKKVISLNRDLLKNNFIPVYSDIVSIVYELMKNTDDWGRTDVSNKPLSPNARGLYLKFHRQKRQTYLNAFNKNVGLKEYFSDKGFEENGQGELYFLELSVFDTGIGFIQRYAKKEVADPSEQVEIIKKCMLKNNTSATGIDKEIKGQGLDRIMRILDNKGFFWLRTANVSIFRNLRHNRYKEKCNDEEIELYDWFNNSSSNFSNLESGQGSVITLVYPISSINE